MTTDTTERGLEELIVRSMTGRTDVLVPAHVATETSVPVAGGTGWLLGDAGHYEREYCVDLVQLRGFLMATQEDVLESLQLDTDGPTRRKFLARLQGEITKRGTIDVLRHGVKHGAHQIDLFYGTPSPGNEKAAERYAGNRFSVTRQLRYSRDEAQRALDMALFINGLPVATFELKNSLTKQTVADAVAQYQRDRDPRETLFQFGRCIAHFAVDEHEVRFCTHLTGKGSWFLPFNQGWNDGAGNPPNPDGLKTDYLWKRILTRDGLTNVLENYAQVVETKDPKTGKKKSVQLWPRYHQLDVVRRLLADALAHGAGGRYLIQHSAGSGKSNSIAWLAHQMIGLKKDDTAIFDSIIVVTDRRILDQQIRDTIKQFAQVGATVGHAEHSGDLRKFIAEGKKIIISTVQKFPFILDEIGNEHRGRHFAIVIDEAHSSQGGKASAALATALSTAGAEEDDETLEDKINRLMEAKKLLPNASYFAFTATPKNKTLEIFGEPDPQADGRVKHRPFHSYTMKQAIQEGFILDVLAYYTPIDSYYKLVKTVESDPEFDTKRAKKKLRRYVESHDHAIRLKAEIMVDHFHEQVLALNKVGGEARAMVVTSGIERAIQYFHAIREYLGERKSRFKAIVAFSGEHEYGGVKVSEASLNGFPSSQIADKIQEDPYRFLICADKFQTGYDEPLLHTMYVDKVLSGIKAVQTLSRLNRAHPKKHDVFVLDFMNDSDTIQEAFADYYRTTVLAEETDPNKLHDLKAAIDGYQVHSTTQIDELVGLYLNGADRDKLDPILDVCVAVYKEQLDEDGQVDFKGKAKAFLRAYGFLSSILPYTNADWEKLSIFLNFLVSKLPAPKEEDLSKGILEAIDMDSYRVEKKAAVKIQLPDSDAEIEPVPTTGGGHKPEPELDRLSNILKVFNDQFGNIPWTDADRVHKLITEDIPNRVAADKAYQNAKQNSDKQNARIEHDKALARVMTAVLKDDTELFKQFMDNDSSPALPRTGPLRNMGSGFGFFDFEPGPCADLPEQLTRLAAKARQTVGPIDGIVLPECAINESDYEKCARAALAESKFLVCGVKGSRVRTFSSNRVRFAIRIGPDVPDLAQELVIGEVDPQPKHHRWMLDGSQIVQYGLGGTLDPTVNWWENIEVGPRRLSFVALEDWLSACVLVCEDLARQDPVADIVRAVGPNLVMALLMDGPQLSSRWAARYATVLADDPGCSVLTLTSLGMTKLSRPPGRPLSRTVGLWKDAYRPEPVEIGLPEGCQAVVLNLSVRYGEELTADGRSDGGKTGFPTFAGMHPIGV